MIISSRGEGVDVPHSGRVHRGIEHHRRIHIPVAVDVFRLRRAPTGSLIVCNLVADAVPRVAVVQIGHYGTLVTLDICVIEKPQSVGESRLQSRITHLDIERVAVVHNRQEVAHARLCRRTAIVYPQVAALVEPVAEVERRCPVQHRSRSVGMHTEIVLHVARVLRLQHYAHIQAVFRAVQAQRHLSLMRISAVFRITAEVCIQIAVQRILEQRQVSVPLTIGRRHAIEEAFTQITEVVCGAIALVYGVFIFVAELQICLARYRFAISSLKRIPPTVCRHKVIPVCLICGIVAELIQYLVQMHVLQRNRGAFLVVIVHVRAHGQVAPVSVKFSVILQHRAQFLVLSVADACVLTSVHHQSVIIQELNRAIVERIVHILIWVFVIRCRHRTGLAVAR